MRLVKSLVVALSVFAVSSAAAQEIAPLILENQPKVKVRTRKKGQETPTPTPSADQGRGEATAAGEAVRPEDRLVAIVNSRALTRAELDARVASRFEKIRDEVTARHGGVVATLDENLQAERPLPMIADDKVVLDEQQRHLDAALRREEGDAVQLWIEHGVLSDEARRQGLIVSDKEFRDRLAQARKESGATDERIEAVLRANRMTREDFEKSVYEALMIEQLLQRFIDLNYTEADFRRAYESNPQAFFEPEKSLVAHFSATFAGTEDRSTVSRVRKKAEKVQELLAKGEGPEKVFSREEFNQLESGLVGAIPGWFTFAEGQLPPVVEVTGRKLRTGEVSPVLEQFEMGDDGKKFLRSLHVVKIVERQPATGLTYESALPAIRRGMLEIARDQLLARLREARTHRIVMNLGGISPSRIPTRDQAMQAEAAAQPISLKLPRT